MESLRHSIGQNIAYHRIDRKISQKDLASLVGCQQYVISKIENGKYNLSIDLLQKIVKALQLNAFLDFTSAKQ